MNFIKISKDSNQWMSIGSLKKVKNDKGKSTSKTEKASTVENTDIALGDDNLNFIPNAKGCKVLLSNNLSISSPTFYLNIAML